jgi:hypothetical protein
MCARRNLAAPRPYRILFHLCASGVCGANCFSADFDFPDFSNPTGLILGYNAHRFKNVLRLTEADHFQSGAVWFPVRQEVQAGFETTFAFRFTNQDMWQGGADGIAFLVQNESNHAIGGFGASGGFLRSDDGAPGQSRPGITRTVAVFFDTFRNRWDDSDNHVAICTSGPAATTRWPPVCQAYSRKLKAKLKNGKPHTARILYEPPRLSVYLDDLPEPIESVSVDIARIVGDDGAAWVGFTASTGGGWEYHDLLSWKFHSGPRRNSTSAMFSTDSAMSTVDSTITFKLGTCMPGRTLCTPEKATVEEKGPGLYHVVLPAHLEWGASIADSSGAHPRIFNAAGAVCWDPRLRAGGGCNGPTGNGTVPGAEAEGAKGFVAPNSPAGALVARVLNGRVWFSINDRTADGFTDNEGFFEFDVELK